MSAADAETRSAFESTTGGVMTVEAGAITGQLEISTRPADGALEARVRYAGADEWYTVEGSPAALETTGDLSPSVLHDRVVEHLGLPGPVVSGNEEPASLRGFSLAPDST
ncbi:MAG TPA: hypothetical protein VHH10_11200 [Rubrobacteraceae bacterium]|nr:hypothetical protein [Rubrobacteraceae bacterium]